MYRTTSLLILILMVFSSCQQDKILTDSYLESEIEQRAIADVNGIMWDDLDGDGIQDFTEPKVEGAKIKVVEKESGDIIKVVETDSEGLYNFELSSGFEYFLKVELPVNAFQDYLTTTQVTTNGLGGLDSDFTNANGEFTTNVFNSGVSRKLDFGIVEGASLEGSVLITNNNTGALLEFQPVPGAIVRLFKFDPNNVDADMLEMVNTVDAEGMYKFNKLRIGFYYLEIVNENLCHYPVLEDESFNGSPDVSSNIHEFDNEDDYFGLTSKSAPFTLSPGEISTEQTTIYRYGVDCSEIKGIVWNDINSDGIRQINEKGISGVKLSIHNFLNDFTHSIVSNEEGIYRIHGQSHSQSQYLKLHRKEGYVISKFTPDGQAEINNDFDPIVGNSINFWPFPLVSNMDLGLKKISFKDDIGLEPLSDCQGRK